MKIFNKIVLFTVALFIGIASCSAFELDMSVDDDIRQNYNPSKLENDVLPDLPPNLQQDTQTSTNNKQKTTSTPKTTSAEVPKTTIDTDYSIGNTAVVKPQVQTGSNSYTEIKVRKGTRFKVKSQTKVSDWNSAGARMTFVSTTPVTKRYVSFPTGTTFKGVIEESHQPTYAGNGGLLKLKADKVSINGNMHEINAKITKADNKFIYFNNIKGKRGYWNGIVKNVNKGEQFYKKTRATSTKMASHPVGVIVSPIPTIVGIVGYGANLIVSPVTAIWSKGEHITLPAGTDYTLKLREDLYLYK